MELFKGMFWTWIDWKAKESNLEGWKTVFVIWSLRVEELRQHKERMRNFIYRDLETTKSVIDRIENYQPHSKTRQERKLERHAKMYGSGPETFMK